MNGSCHTDEHVRSARWHVPLDYSKSWHTYEWVMAHVLKSHGTHMNESCHIYEHVCSARWHIPLDYNESWHMDEWVMANVLKSHGTHMNESRHTYKYVSSARWHVPLDLTALACIARRLSLCRKNVSCHTSHTSRHTHEWVMAHIWMSHGTHMNESCLTHDLNTLTGSARRLSLCRKNVSRHTSHDIHIMSRIWMSHGA